MTTEAAAQPGVPTSAGERVPRRRVDKFEERRDALATAALDTLADLGYARTSLRDIAQRSGFSHGVLHYYFSDKVDLITHCVMQYKARCVLRYDQIVASATTADSLVAGFAEGLAATAAEDATMHRLWYDLRSQSMFESSFRADVVSIDESLQRMIWRIVSCYGQLAGRPLAVDEPAAYGVFDGLFQHALLRHLSGSPEALAQLEAAVHRVMPQLLV